MHFKNTLAMKFLIEKNIDILLSKKFKLKKAAFSHSYILPKGNESIV